MNAKPRKEVPFFVIILICTGLAILLAYGIPWLETVNSRKAPTIMPAPPESPVEILGVDTLNGFGVSDPVIRAADGSLYRYTWQEGQYGWEESEMLEETRDIACQPKNVKQIESIAGPVIACREAHAAGEFGAMPKISYALTAQGELWTLEVQQTNNLMTYCLLALLIPIGALICILVAIDRKKASERDKDLTLPGS